MLGSAEYEMPVQVTHVTLAASGTDPAGHEVQTPFTSTLPEGQRAQVDAPGADVRPTPQSRQKPRPGLGAYLPAVHRAHDVAFAPYCPRGHWVQVDEPAMETLPAWQATQEEAPSEGA